MESVNSLRDQQLLQIKMLESVNQFCKENDIEYFLIGGTALGAARHQGFIPWDDDIDIGMTRTNYDRFKLVAKKNICDNSFVQTTDTDKYSPYPYIKVRMNGTRFVEWAVRKSKMHQGIYIDIFPYDKVPVDESLRKKQFNSVQFYSKFFARKKIPNMSRPNTNYFEVFKEVLRNTLRVPLSLIPDRIILNVLEKKMREYEFSDSNTYACLLFPEYMVESMTHNTLYPLKKAVFENALYPVPNDLHEYLTTHYGDYMELPPEIDRVGHSPYLVEVFQ